MKLLPSARVCLGRAWEACTAGMLLQAAPWGPLSYKSCVKWQVPLWSSLRNLLHGWFSAGATLAVP